MHFELSTEQEHSQKQEATMVKAWSSCGVVPTFLKTTPAGANEANRRGIFSFSLFR
jgi:hypothetical protein